MTKKRPENYESKIIENLMNEISPEKQKKIKRKMMLAVRIADALKEKGMKKKDLARLMNKQPSEITKWLSGTHNFTAETLWEIGDVLGIKLIDLNEKNEEQVIYIGAYDALQKVDLANESDPLSEYTVFTARVKSKQTIHY